MMVACNVFLRIQDIELEKLRTLLHAQFRCELYNPMLAYLEVNTIIFEESYFQGRVHRILAVEPFVILNEILILTVMTYSGSAWQIQENGQYCFNKQTHFHIAWNANGWVFCVPGRVVLSYPFDYGYVCWLFKQSSQEYDLSIRAIVILW